MSLSPARAAQLGRIGALRRHALHDSVELASSGQAGLRARLLAEVDPDGLLPSEEQERRLRLALRAHMLSLAARSAWVRAANKKAVSAITSPAAVLEGSTSAAPSG